MVQKLAVDFAIFVIKNVSGVIFITHLFWHYMDARNREEKFKVKIKVIWRVMKWQEEEEDQAMMRRLRL